MVVATHIIKVRGEFNPAIWNETSLKAYVNKKLSKEIEQCLYPDLELFNVHENSVDVWLFINALPSEVSQEICETWIMNHIKDEGLTVKEVSVEILYDLTKSPESQRPPRKINVIPPEVKKSLERNASLMKSLSKL